MHLICILRRFGLVLRTKRCGRKRLPRASHAATTPPMNHAARTIRIQKDMSYWRNRMNMETDISIRNWMRFASCKSDFSTIVFERPRRSSNKIERVSYTCEKFCNFQSTVFRGARHCPLNCCLESRERAGGGHEWRIIRSLDDIKHIQTPSLWLSAASLASQELQDDHLLQ